VDGLLGADAPPVYEEMAAHGLAFALDFEAGLLALALDLTPGEDERYARRLGRGLPGFRHEAAGDLDGHRVRRLVDRAPGRGHDGGVLDEALGGREVQDGRGQAPVAESEEASGSVPDTATGGCPSP